jgi:hypothetical protein
VVVGSALNVPAPTSTGSAVVTYAISPTLPAGLNFNTATGEVSGSSTAIGSATYTVTGPDAQSATSTSTLTIFIEARPAPVGPVVYSISPSVIYVGLDQEVTITGDRLEGATDLVVRGIELTVKGNTRTQLSFLFPKQAKEGEVELSFRTPQGKLIWQRSLIVKATAPITYFQAEVPSNRRFAALGFDAGSSYLNGTVSSQLKTIAKKIGTTKSVTCLGVTQGPTVLARDAKLSKDRAVAACGRLKTLLPKGIVYVTKNSQELGLGSHIRRVEIEVID